MPLYAHEMKPGDAYAPLRFAISRDLNEQCLFALADYDERYVPGRGRVAQAHPALLLHMSARTRSPSFHLAPNMGSVFARERVVFLGSAAVDEPLEVQWIIQAVYARRDRIYQALDTRVLGDGGREILRREAHSAFFARRPGANE